MPLSLIPAIHRAAHRIALRLEATGLGVTQAEAHILAHLAGPGEATIAELHRALGHRRSTLTSILDRLEARALVTRAIDVADRRSIAIRLTSDGRRLAAQVLEALAALEAAALAGCPPAERKALIRVLDRIAGPGTPT